MDEKKGKKTSKHEGISVMSTEQDVPSSTSKGATLLVLTQMVSKLLTFVLNQLLVRMVSPSLFGVSAYLDFVYSTTLFFSREAERLSIQRTETRNDVSQTVQSIVNFGFVPLAIGIPLSVVSMGFQLRSETYRETREIAGMFPVTLGLYGASVVLELVIEPIYAVNQYRLNFGLRSKYEGISMFLRCVVIIGVVLSASGSEYTKNGVLLLAFGCGQFVYSLSLFTCYIQGGVKLKFVKFGGSSGADANSIEPRWFDEQVVKFWKISYIQMIFKQILTEGDKFIVNSFFSTEERGVFSVLNNYGSIIVRLLFQPIEESVRLSFTRTLAAKNSENNQHLQIAFNTIKYLLIFYLQISLLICLAGSFNGSYLLRVLLGGKSSFWNDTNLFNLFPWFLSYIPFLAFNGVVEAFLSAAASASQTKTYSYFMSVSSLVILVVMYLFIEYFGLGIWGLILANTLNMSLRIIYCTGFIYQYFKRNGILVNKSKVISFVVQNVIIGVACFQVNYTVLDNKYSTNSLIELLKSGVVCCVCLLGLLFTIRKDLTVVIRNYLHKKTD